MPDKEYLIDRRRTLLAVAFLILCSSPEARAFRFTLSSDNRPVQTENIPYWEWCLDEMTRTVGDEGVFHIMPGDFDYPGTTDASLKTQFGNDVVWYPVIGNHELDAEIGSGDDYAWVVAAYPGLPGIVNSGPAGCERTTYSWDYGNAHFIALNEYYDGTSYKGAGGDIVDDLYAWLAADLAANTQPAVFVIGHEPAYPEYRHVGDSLDQHPANRDRFWKLLNDEQVIAYFCGHTHTYYAKQVDGNDWDPVTWQIDCGNSGNGTTTTFVDVNVTDVDVTIDVWQAAVGSPFSQVPFSKTVSMVIAIQTFIYVDGVNGNDSQGTGALTNPYKTIQKALQIAVDGDVIVILAGDYPENITLNKRVTIKARNGLVRIGQ